MAGYQDLLKDTSKPDPSDKNAFLVTIDDLNPALGYPLEFKWKFKDGSFGKDWSNVYTLVLGNEPPLFPPHFASINVSGGSGYISVTWDGKDSTLEDMLNFDRVEIYIKDHSSNTVTTFGDGSKATAFFKTAGTKTITAPAGKYIVKLKTIGVSGKASEAVPSGASDYLVTVTSGITIEDPTLPTGLSVSTVPFGVAVNWSGSYSASSFFGFQSINIYASTTDYGSTTTATNITNSKLVGTMTVNDTSNKITVGLDALRTALGLSANKDCYTTDTYFYYIATNLNGVKYKVSGSEVYTRISSTPVKPTQANFVDLANGVISIENLVAGNGKFTSYLRTGTPDGARIELNGGNSITPSDQTNPVLPGLSVYSSGSTAIFRADLSGNISFGGYTPSDIASISTNADKGISDAALASGAAQTASTLASTKNKIFRTSDGSVPSAVAAGDVWINAYSGTLNGYLGKNQTYVSTSSGTSSWVSAQDQQLKDALGAIVTVNPDGTLFNKSIGLVTGSGEIYSNKSRSDSDSTNGWYLGYEYGTANPAISLGTAATGLIKWTVSGGLKLTGTISGGIVKTAGTHYEGAVQLNDNTDALEFLNSSGSIIGSMHTFNSGNELLIQYGATSYVGYPASNPYLSLSSGSATLAFANSSGYSKGGLTVSSDGSSSFSGALSAATSSLTYPYVRNTIIQTATPDTGYGNGTIWFQV